MKKNKKEIVKKAIIITDPCYIEDMPGCPEALISESTLYGDWSCMAYKCEEDEALKLDDQWWRDIYSKFFHDYNFKGLNEDQRDKLYAEFKKTKKDWIEKYCWGEFCADSGQVAVYIYDEVKEHCPEFLKWMKKHSWCVCVIPDVDIDSVEYIVYRNNNDNGSVAHITGNNFFTTQSGY